MLTVAATIVPSLTKCVCVCVYMYVVSFCVYECIMMIYVLHMYVMYVFVYDRRGGIRVRGLGRREGERGSERRGLEGRGERE